MQTLRRTLYSWSLFFTSEAIQALVCLLDFLAVPLIKINDILFCSILRSGEWYSEAPIIWTPVEEKFCAQKIGSVQKDGGIRMDTGTCTFLVHLIRKEQVGLERVLGPKIFCSIYRTVWFHRSVQIRRFCCSWLL